MKFIALIAAFISAVVATDDEQVVGGYNYVDITPQNTDLLANALSNATNYPADATQPLCLKTVMALQTQVVNGINYKYTVTVCPLPSTTANGKCDGIACYGSPFEIVVYQPAGEEASEIKSIRFLPLQSFIAK